MATKTVKVTLTEKNDAGPLFDLFYSLNGGLSFTSSVDSTNLYLPYVGASTVANVDEGSTAFQLKSKGVCINSVITGSNFITPTPTATSTPTPTPTSTPVASGMVLYEYNFGNEQGGTSSSYEDWDGNTRSILSRSFGDVYRFAAVSGSFNFGNSAGTLTVIDSNFEVRLKNAYITKTDDPLVAFTYQTNAGEANFTSNQTGPYTNQLIGCVVDGTLLETYDPVGVMTLSYGSECLVPTPTPTPIPPTPTGPTPTPTPTEVPGLTSFGYHSITKSFPDQFKCVWSSSSQAYQAYAMIQYLTGQSSPSQSTPYFITAPSVKIWDSLGTERVDINSTGSSTVLWFYDGIQVVVEWNNVSPAGTYANGGTYLDTWGYQKD